MGFFTGIGKYPPGIPGHKRFGMGYHWDNPGLGTMEGAQMGILCPAVGSCVVYFICLVGPLDYQQPKC
jgi:hypothetical protein